MTYNKKNKLLFCFNFTKIPITGLKKSNQNLFFSFHMQMWDLYNNKKKKRREKQAQKSRLAQKAYIQEICKEPRK
jgi:hypothetical protein